METVAGSERAWNALRRISGWRRAGLLLVSDAAAIALAFAVAFLLRFEGRIPPARLDQLWAWLPVLVGLRLALHLVFGIERWSYHLAGFHEAVRVAQTTLLGSLAFTSLIFFLQRAREDVALGPPRSVIAIEFLLTLVLLEVLRFWPRLARMWSLERRRARSGEPIRALIVGAGSAGDLLLRDLQRSSDHPWFVVGFVDDERSKWGTYIGGRPVLGPLAAIPALARRWRVEQLLFAIPNLEPERLRALLEACAGLKLSYKVLPLSFSYLRDRSSGQQLSDLAPEHLLSRPEVVFQLERVRSLLAGRRLLVTGAAGSIGSEIARQAAACDADELVLVDLNENGLYFLLRALRDAHPELRVVAEVADIRDARRFLQLGEAFRPELVFHAAAHKHVPLLESTPEEALKNNVIGARNVAAMAEACGARRFVLISTDKAVNAVSVMGASKRLAELVVRSFAGRSETVFTTVRFGNVLGSAGSVVPLFKQQIAAGGPVTVTDPECRRYLMTLSEAVGLVLLAGLDGNADLHVLEMGAPIRILDLARLMITLSGYVPEKEILIAYTGLRPGEKIDEELMTSEEAATRQRVAEAIWAIPSPPAPAALEDALGELERLAREGSRLALRRALQRLVPTLPLRTEGEAPGDAAGRAWLAEPSRTTH